MKFSFLSIYLLVCIGLISGCKKDEPVFEVDPCLSASPKEAFLSFSMFVDSLPFELQTDYLLSDGHHVKFETAQFYLSGIHLLKDSNQVNLSNDVALITPTSLQTNLGKIEQSSYTGIKFDFGIDSLRNHGDPTLFSAGNPLAIQVPSMHWSWNQGYIFAIFEGKFSTNTINSSNPGNDFSYHIGLDSNFKPDNLRSFTIPLHVSACGDNKIKLRFNAAHVFNGLTLETDFNTQSTVNYGLSTRVRNNIISGITSDQ